jgi:hypothetical protein
LDFRFEEKELLGIDPWKEAVLTASYGLLDYYKINEIDMFGFERLWFKKHFAHLPTPKGFVETPKYFDGHLGIKYCIDNFKFILTPISSCFIEALLFDRVPILMPQQILKEEKIDDLVSLVSVEHTQSVAKLEVITTTNLQNKIKLLRNEDVYKNVIKRLRSQWWPDASFFKTSLREVLRDYVYSFLPR